MPDSSDMEGVEESIMRGCFTCGLSDIVASVSFFFLFHSCLTCLSPVYIFDAIFSFCSRDLAPCNF